MISSKSLKLIKRIIRQAIGAVLVLELTDPVRAAMRLNEAWNLQVDAAGRYVELLTPTGCLQW